MGDRTAEHTIDSIASTARRFAEAGDWRNACASYRAIIEESLVDDYPVDDEGEFIEALNSVLEYLAECLERHEVVENNAERRAVLDSLLDAYIWDVNMSGYGLGDNIMPETLLDHVKLEDVPAIRDLVIDADIRGPAIAV